MANCGHGHALMPSVYYLLRPSPLLLYCRAPASSEYSLRDSLELTSIQPDMTNRMLHWLRCVRAWKADHRAHMDMCLTIRNSGSEAGPTMAPWLDLVPSRAVANKDAKQSLIFSDVAQGWNEYVISNMKVSKHCNKRQLTAFSNHYTTLKGRKRI